ncbi:DUF2637 domain-containing protein [Paractinoplanes toevensis]|uniref:DUF2637 domain-containing protein n=1 Tax=Paractinoplanes toevensis TaxID=571911 RepID=A0A920BQX6_9ACTN|nr:DUF2637 domain-containing protein [Actinoplanes toevensis]GIM97530.1 hypothetical protein Ato02nite_093230 [Actinoplanes toevensis]
MSQDLERLKRIGWAVRAVFTLGITASLAGNVLHAEDNAISQAISAWSPMALLLTVELISRVPVRKGAASYARLAATAVIAGIAAWVSYWHMAGVATRYGETGASPFLLPFSVDGLIVVASISLVEIGGRIRSMTEPVIETPTVSAPASVVADTPSVVAADPAPAVEKVPVKRVTPRPASAAKVAKVAAKMPGASAVAIAEKAGVSPSTARRHLAAQRVTNASPTGPDPAEIPVLAAA